MGAINGSSSSTISLKEITGYVEEKTGKKAILSQEGLSGPYNRQVAFSLDTEKAKNMGYDFTGLNDWIYELLDKYINFIKSKG